jgi:hypothetical protein
MAIVLMGRLAWQGVKYLRHAPTEASRPAHTAPAQSGTTGLTGATPNSGGPAALDPWMRDTLAALDQAAQSAEAGNLSEAESDADRAGSIVVTMRLSAREAAPDFLEAAVAALDRTSGARPENALLVEHVTQTRVELAELRSSMVVPPVTADLTSRMSPKGPRHVAQGQTLDPTSLGASYLDATLMAGTAEMLMPPISRSLADRVSVENLTLAGAAQTLDGIHWRNVTFIGTHLRYEGGPLDLQDVRFVRCRFGFIANERGARIANAIALGQTSIAIE